MDDPFADIPSAAQGLRADLAAIIHAPPKLLDSPKAARKPTAAPGDPLERVNELMAPLVHRKARKARKEAVIAHTTTREATRKRIPRQTSLHYDRRAKLDGTAEPELKLRTEQLSLLDIG